MICSFTLEALGEEGRIEALAKRFVPNLLFVIRVLSARHSNAHRTVASEDRGRYQRSEERSEKDLTNIGHVWRKIMGHQSLSGKWARCVFKWRHAIQHWPANRNELSGNLPNLLVTPLMLSVIQA